MLNKQVNLNKIVNTENITGYVLMKASNNMGIGKISGGVFFEARGLMVTKKEKIMSFDVTNQTELVKDKTHKFPFSFELPEDKLDSYKGKNVTFSYNCEIQVDVNATDIDKLERSVFTKVKSFLYSDNSIKFSRYFSIKNPYGNYQVTETKANFNIRANITLSVIAALLFGAVYISLIPANRNFYIFLGFGIIILLIYLLKKLIGNVLGVISLETIRDEDAFLCKIWKTKSFRLTSLNIHYEIVEEVVDDRGTRSRTRTESLYSSDKKKISNFKRNSDIKFHYPNKKGLQSVVFGDASILWEMHLEGRYFGLTLKYKCLFKVKQI